MNHGITTDVTQPQFFDQTVGGLVFGAYGPATEKLLARVGYLQVQTMF